MIRSIAVPLDRSSFSEHALGPAVAIARRTGASLELLLVYEPATPVVPAGTAPMTFAPVPVPPPPNTGMPDVRLEHDVRAQHEAYLRGVAERVRAESGVNASARVLDGPVVEALTEHIAMAGPDLVVTTTHGRGGLSRLLLGSTAEGVVRGVSTPVLVVKPPKEEVAAPASSGFGRVLIPLDGSVLAEAVIEPAVEVARAHGEGEIECTLVHVVEPMTVVAAAGLGPVAEARDDDRQRQESETRAYLEQVAERVRPRGVTVHVRPLMHRQAARAIVEHAAESGTDLIAMATHGRGGLRRLVLGSVAEAVLRDAETNVLLYRPDVPTDDESASTRSA